MTATKGARRGKKNDGVSVVLNVFGGILQEQGRGFYVPLELFAIIWGSVEANEQVLRSDDQPVRYMRRVHDYARRLLASPELLGETERDQLDDKATERTLRALLRGLTVPVPGRRSMGNWRTQHFFPYVGDLIHYEAVMRGSKINIERNYYRGGGALAHRILREDSDQDRLEATRVGFRALVGASASALGRAAAALSDLDRAHDEDGFADDAERQARCLPTRWLENLRAGVNRIVCREGLGRAKRVDALMYWVPFCIALHQLELANRRMNLHDEPVLPVDCRAGKNPVRALARMHAKQAVSTIYVSLYKAANELNEHTLLDGSPKWRQSPRTFFSTTAGSIGLFNAITGVRHFTIRSDLLEAIVLATVDREVEFERFCEEILFKQLGLVVDGRAATAAGFLKDIDRAAFDDNAAGLLEIARDLGMVHEFSDATRMIRARLA